MTKVTVVRILQLSRTKEVQAMRVAVRTEVILKAMCVHLKTLLSPRKGIQEDIFSIMDIAVYNSYVLSAKITGKRVSYTD